MLRPGDRFARYRIEKMLGEGGMGLVYRAYDTELDRRVALKIVHGNVANARPGATDTERDRSLSEAAARLLREGREAAGFNHPNAVSVIDVGEHGGTPYIAMELVSGRTLRTYVGDRAITMDRRISWLAQIAEGLEAAHLRGLVHRDVKPENVMVCNDGTVKLMDFGGVKKMEEEKPKGGSSHPTFVTRAGMVVGTPMYMAPEQAIGEQLDGRSDQFAWGTLAYELLSGGIHPIRTNNPKNLPPAFAVIQRHPKPLSEVGPEIPSDVRDIVTRAMKKSRDDRYETMGEIASALRRYLKHKHTNGIPPSSSGPSDDLASAPTIAISRDKPLRKAIEEAKKARQKKQKAKNASAAAPPSAHVPIVANVSRKSDAGSIAVWMLVGVIALMAVYVIHDFIRVMSR
ncbi:MAG TPA: serine/threonine-protein kinase [Polyangiaceae bacterium]